MMNESSAARLKEGSIRRKAINAVVHLSFVILFIMLSPIYYLNRLDFKRNIKRNPFYTSKLVQLQMKLPRLFELAMLVQSFPLFFKIYNVLPEVKGDVLQVGCGTGLLNMLKRRDEGIRWVNLDPNLDALQYGEKRGRFSSYVQGYIDKRTPLPDQSFDVILFARCFHHIRNHRKAFNECSRLLRNEGVIIIQDPVVLEEKGDHKAGYMANSSIDGVVWRFTQQSFIEHVESQLPADLMIQYVYNSRQPHVTNYNLFVKQTDLVAVIQKRRDKHAGEDHCIVSGN